MIAQLEVTNHCEERSDEAIQIWSNQDWIASLPLATTKHE